MAAFDNLDHNPSSTTAQGSFHGTGTGLLEVGMVDEQKWFQHGMQLLAKERLPITYPGLHFMLSLRIKSTSSSSCYLCFMRIKAATLSMVKHGMDVVQLITTYLTPGQIPVMAFDQPLFALAKFVQWSWPETYGEKNYVVMWEWEGICTSPNTYHSFSSPQGCGCT